MSTPPTVVDEELYEILPLQAMCDEHEDFDTCPIVQAKAEIKQLIARTVEERVVAIIGEDEPTVGDKVFEGKGSSRVSLGHKVLSYETGIAAKSRNKLRAELRAAVQQQGGSK